MVLDKIRRHAAITTGNFQKLFGRLDPPPLPVAVVRLIELSAREDTAISEYGDVIRSDSALASRVLRLVNSAAMGVRFEITDIDRAVALLGIARVRSLALAVGAARAVPDPKSRGFDRAAFWQDSLQRALVAKALAGRLCPGHEAEAFTGALLQNVAIPILLERWGDYYEPVLADWREETLALAHVETQRFGWNHAEAGAWIARVWKLPDALVCAAGLHHASWDQLAELQLATTAVGAGALGALVPSVLKPTEKGLQRWSALCATHVGMPVADQCDLLSEAHEQLEQVGEAFGLGELRDPLPIECLQA